MLNSILMLGSTYESKKLNLLFALGWILFTLFRSDFSHGIGLQFTIINFSVFSLVFLLGKLFAGRYSNKIISVFSILIWNILIDTTCYFLFPQFSMGQSLLLYVSNGILFNYQFIFSNVLIVATIQFLSLFVNSFQSRLKTSVI